MLFLPEYLSEMPKAVKWRQNLILIIMMKSKFNLLKIAGMAIALTFFACEKGKDKDSSGGSDTNGSALTINATDIQNSIADITLAAAVLPLPENNVYVLGQTEYKNNSFTLSLPASVEDQYLVTNRLFLITGFPDECFSKPKNKMNDMFLVAVDRNKQRIGLFVQVAIADGKEITECYVYSKENCDVKAEGKLDNGIEISINCSFKKGWNTAYGEEDKNNKKVTWTTPKPTGLTWKWVFEKDEDEEGDGKSFRNSNYSFQTVTAK